MAITSLVAPSVVKKLGWKKSLLLGGLGQFLFVFLSVFPVWANEINQENPDEKSTLRSNGVVETVLIFGVFFSGVGAALLWVAQGEYFSLCMTEESKGFYFGFFWSIYQSSQIFGNLFGAVLLKALSDMVGFFIIMSIIALLASISFLFIRKPHVHRGRRKDANDLANESQYFTEDSIMGQSIVDMRFSGKPATATRFKSGKGGRHGTEISEDVFDISEANSVRFKIEQNLDINK